MTRRFVLLASPLVVGLFAVSAFAGEVFVNGHTRPDGTYVQPHMRTVPDGDSGAKRNVDPYSDISGPRVTTQDRDGYPSGSRTGTSNGLRVGSSGNSGAYTGYGVRRSR